ncbi:MAG: malate synthase G [Acidimicrobiaceae bacterium]|nr:malate synthase G [Acidimicrobiaceae bacterium]
MHSDNLSVAPALAEFVRSKLLPGTGVEPDSFWVGFEEIIAELGPRNTHLLDRRDQLQEQIDQWHRDHEGHEVDAYADFLREIGYIDYVSDDVSVATEHVDVEISSIAGPQLVVPLDNSRYALNAANARWRSLYDALYGTDVIDGGSGCSRTAKYNPIRGERVIRYGRDFLDRHFSLDRASHHWITSYFVENGDLKTRSGDGTVSTLLRPERFVAYTGNPASPDSILLRKNGLGCEIHFGEGLFIGRRDHANIYDILLESAVTAIMDCEDSVCAVDLDDKLVVYGNWLGLMKGTLTRSFTKGAETVHRTMDSDRRFTAADGSGEHVEHGRSLMLVRNVGPHLTTDIVTYKGEPVPETMLDALITSAAALHDLNGSGEFRNSRAGSVYIVKPKMHGPNEVALACELFSRVESVLGLAPNTLKMGIMDEERRTSLGLKACLEHARKRVVFINTGFLDRTGDEIHTDMEAGPVLPKGEMKGATWLQAYENSNVDTGLACGLKGRAQIGKGMWAMPSEMAEMVKTKIAHPLSGANCAWVPSPTAATLHAIHYFLLDVADRQRDLIDRPRQRVNSMLAIPILAKDRVLSTKEIERELENNVQGILGYVARWVGQGVGCSTVSDIDDIGLMEDLATLRISSQHVANWLHHDVVTEDQVRSTMQRMAAIVDQQNAGDASYQPMAPDFETSIPFQASLDLVLKGRVQPNGYTEAILRGHRRAMKQQLG